MAQDEVSWTLCVRVRIWPTSQAFADRIFSIWEAAREGGFVYEKFLQGQAGGQDEEQVQTAGQTQRQAEGQGQGRASE